MSNNWLDWFYNWVLGGPQGSFWRIIVVALVGTAAIFALNWLSVAFGF